MPTDLLAAAQVSASTADRVALLVAVGGVGLVAMAVMRRYPRLGMLAWLLAICFVPVWVGITIKVYFYPASVAAIVVLVGVWPWRRLRLGMVDLMVGVLFLACLVPLLVGGYTRTTVFVVLSQWLAAYLVGRWLPARVGLAWTYKCVVVLFAIVSVGAIIEMTFHFNPFVEIKTSNPLYQVWGTIQSRGGQPRAEGAFGHSIALGTSIAMALPLVLAAPIRLRTRLIVGGLMIIGVVATFSRAAMLCAVLAVLLCVLFMRRELTARSRKALLAVGVVVGAIFVPFVSDTLTEAGSEATNSADYRDALTTLIPDFSVLGYSSIATRTPTGDLYFGKFQSIDSQLILTGLTYGWIALLIGLALLVVAIVVVLRGRAGPPTLAVVAGIPSLATVAFITQYTMFFWFIAGLAVFAQMSDRPPRVTSGVGGSARLEEDHSFLPYSERRVTGPVATVERRPVR